MVKRDNMRKAIHLKWLWITVLIVILDQATKWLASTQLEFHQLTNVMPYFDWYLAHNEGAAFSFLADQGGWQRWFLVILTSVISIGLVIWLNKLESHQKFTAIAICLILGGAIGNIIDRASMGYVVDFIQIWLGTYPWPSFNFADMAISVGAVLLISADLLLGESKDEKPNE